MVVDALVHANSYLGISSNIHDPSEYWKVMRGLLTNKLVLKAFLQCSIES